MPSKLRSVSPRRSSSREKNTNSPTSSNTPPRSSGRMTRSKAAASNSGFTEIPRKMPSRRSRSPIRSAKSSSRSRSRESLSPSPPPPVSTKEKRGRSDSVNSPPVASALTSSPIRQQSSTGHIRLKSKSSMLPPFSSSNMIKNYLLLYDILSLILWSIFFILLTATFIWFPMYTLITTGTMTSPTSAATSRFNIQNMVSVLTHSRSYHSLYQSWSKAFEGVGLTLGYIQLVSLLEIVHILLGWVKADISIALTQHLARNIIIWVFIITYGTTQVQTHPAFMAMAATWAIGEVIRFAYHTWKMFTKSNFLPRWLIFARYSFFYFLYPIGVGSEIALLHEFVQTYPSLPCLIKSFLIVIMYAYLPAFYILYDHMVQQRKKIMGTANPFSTVK